MDTYIGASYTPAITPSDPSSTATFDGISFTYFVFSNTFLIVAGRFRVASVGTVTCSINVSLPTGYTVQNTGVGTIGTITTAPTSNFNLDIRGVTRGANHVMILRSGGNHCLPALSANTYIMMFAFVPLVR